MNIKKEDLLKLLKQYKYVKSDAAKAIGIGETSMRRACAKYNIDTNKLKAKEYPFTFPNPAQVKIVEKPAEITKYVVKSSEKKDKVQLGSFVVVPDLHSYMYNVEAFNAVCKFIKDFKPEYLIQSGDLLELNCLMGYYGKSHIKLTDDDMAELDKDFATGSMLLSTMAACVPKETKKYWLLGNHEYRIVDLLKFNPAWEIAVSIEKRMNLTGWSVKPYLEPLKLGKLNVFHGEFYNQEHLRKHLIVYQKNLLYGHTHSISQGTLASPMREIPTWAGNIGCLCDTNPAYQRNKSNTWEHGFCFGYFDKKEGDFYPYIVRIIKGRFIANGKEYKG